MALIPPAGVSPLSTPVAPVSQPKQAPIIFADDIGDNDSDTPGDFLSLTESADPIDDSVRQMFMLKRNSGAVARNKGQRFESIRYTEDLNIESATGLVEETLKNLVEQGSVTIVSISTEGDGDTGLMSVEFRNNVTGEKFTRKVTR